MIFPSFKEFKRLAKPGCIVPVVLEIIADELTPVSVFKRIGLEANHSFLLESVEGGEHLGRYSFVSSSPEIVFEYKDGTARLSSRSSNSPKVWSTSQPLADIKDLLKRYTVAHINGLPRFYGGAVGYINYDVIRTLEKLPPRIKNQENVPDIVLMFTANLLCFDHLSHTLKIIRCVKIDKKSNVSRLYREAVAEIAQVADEVKKIPAGKDSNAHKNKKHSGSLKYVSNMRKAEFLDKVKRAKEYIRAGDVIQVVISQKFQTETKSSPVDIYRALRVINPSPYMFFLNAGKVKLVGSSPELLIRLDGNIAETRPIAGTRPRGDTQQSDAALEESLLNDPKERAEHIMLVDLGRNDLGRVCVPGSVTVPEFMKIERYSHVMHIVSSVKGRIFPNKSAVDLFSACFPAGTVAGAPKIRAMEIIEELENVSRGPYAGAVGYFGYDGNMDMAITIRTIVLQNNIAYVQAGAGIVADSEPEREYLESKNKAAALLAAIRRAEKGL